MKTNCQRVMEWRTTHLEEYKAYQKEYQRKIYKENYDNVRAVQKKNNYRWKKQTQSHLDILNNFFPL